MAVNGCLGGFEQQYGIDYKEIFSLVVNMRYVENLCNQELEKSAN